MVVEAAVFAFVAAVARAAGLVAAFLRGIGNRKQSLMGKQENKMNCEEDEKMKMDGRGQEKWEEELYSG